jgi:hypothetical protein
MSAASYISSGKRLPAFGRELLQIRQRGLAPDCPLIAVCLDGWTWGKAYARCVIPPDLDPLHADLRFVAGLDTVLILSPSVTTIERRDATIRQLLACLPASLRSLEIADPILWTWIKSRKHGLELMEYA